MGQLEKSRSAHPAGPDWGAESPAIQSCGLLRSQGQWEGGWQGLDSSQGRAFLLLYLTSAFFLQIQPAPSSSQLQHCGLFFLSVFPWLASRTTICGLLNPLLLNPTPIMWSLSFRVRHICDFQITLNLNMWNTWETCVSSEFLKMKKKKP